MNKADLLSINGFIKIQKKYSLSYNGVKFYIELDRTVSWTIFPLKQPIDLHSGLYTLSMKLALNQKIDIVITIYKFLLKLLARMK